MSEGFTRVDVPGLLRLLRERPGLDVIDVRELPEWNGGHLPMARHVPLSDVKAAPLTAAPADGVVFVCQKGGRSATAAAAAVAAGRGDVFSVDGGTEAWIAAGHPVERVTVARAPTPAQTDGELPDEVPDLGLDAIVGQNLKRHRAAAGMSLDELAGRSGVSRTLLGQVELGRAVPSIGIVWKIAQALGVPFSTLLSVDGSAQMRVLKRSAAKRLQSADGRFVSRALFPFDEPQQAEFYELWLAPRAKEEALPHRPGTRENLIVTQGKMALKVGSEVVVLDEGDALSFHADVAHAYENLTNAECWAYLVMTYENG